MTYIRHADGSKAGWLFCFRKSERSIAAERLSKGPDQAENVAIIVGQESRSPGAL